VSRSEDESEEEQRTKKNKYFEKERFSNFKQKDRADFLGPRSLRILLSTYYFDLLAFGAIGVGRSNQSSSVVGAVEHANCRTGRFECSAVP